MLNVAMHLVMESTDPKDRPKLAGELTGKFRTLGGGLSPEEMTAPSWWHGDDEAYESSMAAMVKMPQRGRSRR